MRGEIFRTDDWVCFLTPDSPASSYGMPAIRIDGEGAKDLPEFGPADMIAVQAQGIYVGILVALWGMWAGRRPEDRESVQVSFRQWPEGMQVA